MSEKSVLGTVFGIMGVMLLGAVLMLAILV